MEPAKEGLAGKNSRPMETVCTGAVRTVHVDLFDDLSTG
jgi:hypothetical protein